MRRIKDIESLRQLIKSELTLEDVAEHYGIHLKQQGDQLVSACPFHQETKPSFNISPAKQLFHCHGCKAGGDVFSFVQKYEVIEFMEAMRRLAEIANIDIQPFLADLTPEEKRLAELYRLNEFVLQQAVDHDSDELSDWLTRRRINPETAELYRVGFSGKPPSRQGAKAEVGDWKSLGLTRQDQWTDTLVIPLIDPYGRVAGFRNRPHDPGVGPKVLASHKEHPIGQPPFYGVYEARSAIRRAGYVIIVEGEVDVWQMVDHGFDNTIAMIGTKLTDESIQYLESLGIERIVLLADGDAAGRKFSLSVARKRFKSKTMVKIAQLNGGDPDEILLGEGPGPVTEAIDTARYQFEYLIEQVVPSGDISASQIVDILHELKGSFASAPDYEMQLIANQLSLIFNMAPESLIDFFREANIDEEPLYNLRAERVVLRQMIDDQEFIGEASIRLKRDDFYLMRHRIVFDALSTLFRQNENVNEDVLRTYLANRNEKDTLKLLDNLGSYDLAAESAEFMMFDIKDKAVRRQTQKQARELIAKIGNTSIDSKLVIQGFSSSIAQIIAGDNTKIKTSDQLARERVSLMHERLKDPRAIIGLDLGPDWKVLNHTIHGLQENRYVVIAAPTGVGKTLVANSWMRRISVELNEPSTMLSFETTPETCTDRIISQMSGVESDKILTGFLTEDEVELVQDAAAAVASAPMIITSAGRTIEECIAIMRNDYLRRGTRVFFIDYIQIMFMASKDRNVNRTQELEQISGLLQEFANTYPVAVVVLAQINREGVKKGTNITKEDTGAVYKVGQDADIFYIVRMKTKEELDMAGPEKGDRWGWLDKHRHGRANVGSDIKADLACNRIWEI